MDIYAEQTAEKALRDKLDACLIDHAKALTAGDGPQIEDVYRLHGEAEVHYYLKAMRQFDPSEVEALLQFADPLLVAYNCWEENSHEYSFPICELLKSTKAKEHFALAEPEPPGKLSIRDRLRTGIKEARQQAVPVDHAKETGHDRYHVCPPI